MAYSARSVTTFVAGMFHVASLATAAHAQSPQYSKPTELPNPYRLVEGWPTLPESTQPDVASAAGRTARHHGRQCHRWGATRLALS